MKKIKYFACSDIHSAYTPWITALKEQGFDENNPNHKIILCGDLFDRMDESQETYDFAVKMIQKEKLIYIKGNHESLLEDFLKRRYPLYHDWSNGTAKTVMDLAPEAKNWEEACPIVKEKIKILQDHMIDYFETKKKNYIFVHSCVPHTKYDWRECTYQQWEKARWQNPFITKNNTDKIIIHGHWHNSYGWAKMGHCSEFGEDAIFDICPHDNYIGLDSCVAWTNKINIFVFEEDS